MDLVMGQKQPRHRRRFPFFITVASLTVRGKIFRAEKLHTTQTLYTSFCTRIIRDL